MIEQLAAPVGAPAGDTATRSLAFVAAGGLAGALLGVAARAWMRLISSDPEFTWSGTLFIVGLFAVVGLAQGIALAVRRRRWPRWAQRIVQVVAAATGLLLGGGAGSLMLVALVTAPLAIARTDWPSAVRVVLGVVAGVNSIAVMWVAVEELTPTRAIVGWLVMVALYAAVTAGLSLNLRPLHRSTGSSG